jgi:enamine deaminase RidA (YjgF/YER057c/UK114 family)
VRTGNLVTIAGQLPMRDGKLHYAGKLGLEINEPDGRAAARLCCLNALAQLKAAVGSLDNVVRIVRLDGYVASAAGFTAQPAVLNGASEFLLEVFGAAGRHARAAVGVAELPLGASVEIVLWAEVRD